MSGKPRRVRRVSAYVPVTPEVLADADALRQRLASIRQEERARTEEWRAGLAARRAAAMREARARHEAARKALGNPEPGPALAFAGKLLAVLDLHGPVERPGAFPHVECHGCESEGAEAESPEWPCATWLIAAGQTP